MGHCQIEHTSGPRRIIKRMCFPAHSIVPICAAATASLCMRAKGTIPSMPEKKAILQLLKEHPAVEKEKICLNDEEQVLLLLKEQAPFANETIPGTSTPVEKNLRQRMPIQPESVTV